MSESIVEIIENRKDFHGSTVDGFWYKIKIPSLQKILDMSVKLEQENAKLKAQNDSLLPIVEMLEDHRKMPHEHKDAQTKLYCLTERASEALKKIKVDKPLRDSKDAN
jgi:hypothetical protein